MDENKLPRPAMIALTVLRVVIGWHFPVSYTHLTLPTILRV